MNGPTELNGITNIINFEIIEILEQNIISFFNWGLLNVGGFTNNTFSSLSAYGADPTRLRMVTDPRFTEGTVWEGSRMNWVYETGLGFANQPISISGLFINGGFYPVTDNSYYIDYPNGRVIFNNPVDSKSIVRLEHSSKWVNVTSTFNVPWLRISQNNSFRVDDPSFIINSGEWGHLSETRMQFPTIAVEVLDGNNKGFQLGGGQWAYNKVNFFVIGEDKNSVDRLANIIQNQNEKTIYVYDCNRLMSDNKYPLNQFGTPIAGFLTYPSLIQQSGVGGYRLENNILYGKMTFRETQLQSRQQLMQNIYQRSAVATTEVILPNIP